MLAEAVSCECVLQYVIPHTSNMPFILGEKILTRSLLKGWEWDCENIECCTISDRVAELFTFKMKSLQDEAITSLKVCSIFGSRIDIRLINLIQGYDGDRSVDLNAGVKAAIELGLVEKTGSPTVFKFAHDIIVQVLYFRLSCILFK